ncbi:hypothetical protein TNCV_4327201 [Trichonephila clavipes]|nr:hypothetical protein TNCV_4327201 [Trichonephila clavipes]
MEGNAGRVGWGETREGVEGTEITRSGRRGPQAPQRLVIQNPHFSTTTHACRILLRPKRSALDRSGILTYERSLPYI